MARNVSDLRGPVAIGAWIFKSPDFMVSHGVQSSPLASTRGPFAADSKVASHMGCCRLGVVVLESSEYGVGAFLFSPCPAKPCRFIGRRSKRKKHH